MSNSEKGNCGTGTPPRISANDGAEHHNATRYVLRCAVLAAAYAVSGHAGILLAYTEGDITLIWAPIGIAVAALTHWGLNYWPGVFTGAVAGQLLLGAAPFTALWIAAGGTLAPAAGAWFLRRSASFDAAFTKRPSILYFMLVPALGCALISASNGTMALYTTGALAADRLASVWLTCWLRDAAGVLVAAPVFLTATRGGYRSWRNQWSPGEFTLCMAILVATAILAFSNPPLVLAYPTLVFLPLPVLFWGALRGGAFVSALSTLILSAVAVSFTILGLGPFAQADVHTGAVSLWCYITCASVASFMFVSIRSEREAVLERLKKSEAFLNATGQMARVGGWELDALTGTLSWTEETYRIHDVEIGNVPALDQALDFYDAGDRDVLAEAIDRALRRGEGYDLTLGFTTARGRRIRVRTVCRPQWDGDRVVKLVGTFQDITQQAEAEQAIREAETKYRILAENVNDVIWTSTLDLELTYVSPSIARVRGVSQEETLRQGSEAAVPPYSLAAVREVTSDILAQASMGADADQLARTVEMDAYRADGSTFTVEMAISLLRDAEGEPSGFLGVARDISERKVAERALRESEALLATAGRIARVGGWQYDALERTTSWSAETYRILHRPAEYVPDLATDVRHFHPDDQARIAAATRAAIKFGQPYDLEFRIKTARDALIWVRCICKPLTASGRTLKLLGTVQDITERKEAEAHLRLLESVITHTNDAIMIAELKADERDPRIVFVNEAFTRMSGYNAAEVIGHSPRLLQGPETDRAELRRLREAILAGEPCAVEVLNYRKNGEPFWNDIHVAPVRDAQGNCTHYIAIERDMTERRRVDRERMELGARAAAVIENAVDAIITIDERGHIESANPAAERLFGYSVQELQGRNISLLMPPGYRREHDGYLERYLESGEAHVIGVSREVQGLRKDGSTFPVLLSVAEIALDGQRRYTGILHDLTHEAELERQLRQAQKLESLGTFAGGIAHDFNNILQAVLGFCHIARQGLAEQKYTLLDQCMEEIDKGSTRAAELVSQILAFSQEASVELAPMELGAAVDEAQRYLSGTLPASIRLDSQIHPGACVVRANRAQIHQVVQNLASNAVHAMEESGGTLRVELDRMRNATGLKTRNGVLPPGEYARLVVADTGHGIAPEILDRVFDPFFTTKKKGKGTGLGLASVHGIVSIMGGGIILETAPGSGTTIELLLPLLSGDFADLPSETALAEPDEPAMPVPGTKAIVVDDEDAIVQLLTCVLDATGYQTTGFTEADVALAVFQADPGAFDVAILDYTMPKMSGIDLAREMHALNSTLPIFLATGMMDEAALEIPGSAGIVDVIKKPFRTDHLLAMLGRARPGPGGPLRGRPPVRILGYNKLTGPGRND